jgi:hypothetical protein
VRNRPRGPAAYFREAIVAGVRALRARGVERPTAMQALEEARELRGVGQRGKSSRNTRSFVADTSYVAARLKRDHPDVVARVEAVVASALVSNVPMGHDPHPPPTRLERLAARAGLDPDDLRDYLYEQVEQAEERWRQELAKALAGELLVDPRVDQA